MGQGQGAERVLEVDTFSHVIKHPPNYKAAGPMGDRYEHIKAMPSQLVYSMSRRYLNAQASSGCQDLWRAGLLLAGDKGKCDDPIPRPITVGSAMRQIVGRFPAAQLKQDFAGIFSHLRQLGIAVDGGIEVAYHSRHDL